MLLGEKIKQAINRSGLDPNQVAAAINMSTANLYRIFKRESTEIKYIMQIADLVRVPYTALIEGDGNDMQQGNIPYSMRSTAPVNKAENTAHMLELAGIEKQALQQRLRDKDEIINLLRAKAKTA